MFGIKKPLKILDPHNFRAAVKGREAGGEGEWSHAPLLSYSWSCKGSPEHCNRILISAGSETPQVRRDLRVSPWSSRVSPEAGAGYSKLSHKHKSPKTAPRIPNQERSDSKSHLVILTEQQVLEQPFSAGVWNRPWRTPALVPSTPPAARGKTTDSMQQPKDQWTG